MSCKEIEIKLKAESLENLKKAAISLGFNVLSGRHHEYNIVYDTPDHRFRHERQLLRLRNTSSSTTITFKQPVRDDKNGLYKIREEIESRVEDFENMRKIFKLMGYKEIFIYEKFREVMQKDRLQIMFDETPSGNYIELEGSPEDIDQTASDLGYSKKDYLLTNYLTIWKEAGNPGNMVFPL